VAVNLSSRHEKLLGECLNKIKTSKVLIAGAGGLGTAVLTLLARLGVGTIYVVDPKRMNLPDLNRQILYDLQDVGKHKVLVAKEKVEKVRKDLEIFPLISKVDENEEFYGQVTVVTQNTLKDFKMFLEGAKEKAVRQIFPPIVTTIASLQVNEFVKILCGYRDTLIGEILCIDLKRMIFETLKY